jgi:glyoxylate/hydroxypyruvate reductase A
VLPTVSIKLEGETAEHYIREMRRLDPRLEIREWPDIGNPEDVDIAMVWKMPHGELAKFPNLKLIISMAAGVDHVLSDPDRPEGVPIVRVTDPHMARSMGHWFLMNILRLHRETAHYDKLRSQKIWPAEIAFDTDSVSVGILGLGYLGVHVAQMLKAVGLRVQGWSRTEKNLAGIHSFSGRTGLDQMLSNTNYLACLLPNTPVTEGIMNLSLFNKMPRGSYVLNAGRGSQLVESDLLEALNNGQIKGAALDVFETEPLPKDHPFWTDSRILLTPHHAAEVFLPAAAKIFLKNIYSIRNNQPLTGLVNQELGY